MECFEHCVGNCCSTIGVLGIIILSSPIIIPCIAIMGTIRLVITPFQFYDGHRLTLSDQDINLIEDYIRYFLLSFFSVNGVRGETFGFHIANTTVFSLT